jgi:dihydroorotase
MGCYGFLAMPNTKPPVAKVLKSNDGDVWSIEEYRSMIMDAGDQNLNHFITPLYITRDTNATMIKSGVETDLLKSAKYYPPHGTTNADFGLPMDELMKSDVLQAMSDHGVILNIHGEQHGLDSTSYFDRDSNAEHRFYSNQMPRLAEKYPDLKIVCEHITTKTAVDFVNKAGDNIAATITPQHLLYTVGDLIMGLKYHLFCLPVVKFDQDRQALLTAVSTPNQTKFFAGTDSAAHTVKATECGCAAGCFTGGIAPQLYAQAFETIGMDFTRIEHVSILKKFLCDNAAHFYNLSLSNKTFTLTKTPQKIHKISTNDGDITPLPLGLGQDTIPWTLTL